MTLANQQPTLDAAALEKVLVSGNLSQLSSAQRLEYYAKVCDSVGLNPLTKPFQYITFQGNLTLYAGRNCTDQLAKIHGISLNVDDGKMINGTWIVRATASDASGRKADAVGAVYLGEKKGEALANDFMKAETKAKRRAVLSFTGLSMLDETEVDTVPGMVPVEEPPPMPELPRPEYSPWVAWAEQHGFTAPDEFTDLLESISDVDDGETVARTKRNSIVVAARRQGIEYNVSTRQFEQVVENEAQE